MALALADADCDELLIPAVERELCEEIKVATALVEAIDEALYCLMEIRNKATRFLWRNTHGRYNQTLTVILRSGITSNPSWAAGCPSPSDSSTLRTGERKKIQNRGLKAEIFSSR